MNVSPGSHIEYDELVSDPTYRIHFWVIESGWAPALESHVLTGATNVHEAVEWAEANGAGRPWELFAQLEVLRTLGSAAERWWVRLYGESPLEGD